MTVTGVDTTTNAPSSADRRTDRLREVAGQVAGKVFFGTLLSTMRESSLKGSYGHGGRGEEVFSAQLHEKLAEQMGQADAHGLTDALVKRFEKQTRLVTEQGRFERVVL